MTLEERVKQLEAQMSCMQLAFVQYQKNQVPITARTDSAYNKCPQVDVNTAGVHENDSAICDIASLSDENSNALEELAAMIQDHEDRIEALEQKEE